MKRKLLLESLAITVMLAIIAFSALSAPVFAWTYYDTNFQATSDGLTFQVSSRVTGYYNTPGAYPETLHQSYRGIIYGYYVGPMYYEWWSWGGSAYDTGIQSVDDIYAFQYFYPAQAVNGAATYTASYFYSYYYGMYIFAETYPNLAVIDW